MGCLIEIVYTEKASKEPTLFFLRKYQKHFSGAEILSAGKVNDRYVVKIYLQGGENHVSRICRGFLELEPRIDKVVIVS